MTTQIHHISIPAENPQNVAQVLAEIWQGKAFPFPVFPGSYLVITDDPHGTAIEVSPLGTELIPGTTEVIAQTNPVPPRFTATHAALTVPLNQAEIEVIGAREGWRVLHCQRGPAFEVIEFWVENRLLLELLTPQMAHRYLTFMNSENWQKFLSLAAA